MEGSDRFEIGIGEGNFAGYVSPVFWSCGHDQERRVRSDERRLAMKLRLQAIMETDPELQRILAAEIADRRQSKGQN
jgi:predicted metalloprotease